MRRTKEQINQRMTEVCQHMIQGGTVLVKDKYDKTVKESRIIAVYNDKTVVLPDTVHSEYGIFDITLKPIK